MWSCFRVLTNPEWPGVGGRTWLQHIFGLAVVGEELDRVGAANDGELLQPDIEMGEQFPQKPGPYGPAVVLGRLFDIHGLQIVVLVRQPKSLKCGVREDHVERQPHLVGQPDPGRLIDCKFTPLHFVVGRGCDFKDVDERL